MKEAVILLTSKGDMATKVAAAALRTGAGSVDLWTGKVFLARGWTRLSKSKITGSPSSFMRFHREPAILARPNQIQISNQGLYLMYALQIAAAVFHKLFTLVLGMFCFWHFSGDRKNDRICVAVCFQIGP